MKQFPVGIYQFSPNKIINFELNRWHSFGFARLSDLKEASKSIKNIEDNMPAFLSLAKNAEAEGRMENAAIYYRAAEFYLPGGHPEKKALYDNFLECFYSVFADLERIKIPYEDSFLRALLFTPAIENTKGFIVAHGGFDSFIEEFYYIFDYFRNLGYTVVAFEGPGQGYTLRKFGLTLTHDWEKPTKAVLDYFNINDATILGISLGGYWCLRAAAFEPRIKRVVAYGLVFDFMSVPNDFLRKVTEWFLKNPKLLESSIRLKMKFDQDHRWSCNQWAYITGAKSVGEVPMHMLAMNQKHMHPERITQDVLLLTGEEDEFFPVKLMEKQKANLSNARSVATRVFTREENAANHCQVGNIGLALRTIAEWMDAI